MSTSLGDIYVSLGLKDQDFKRGLDQSENRAKGFASVVNGFFERIGHRAFDALANAVVTGLHAAVGAIEESITAASDLNESINKTGVVFGKSANEVVKWSQTTAEALGISSRESLEAAAGYGNLFTSLGIARDAAADMSEKTVKLAADLASLNNITPEAALEKLRAGLVGETEPLRVVGVFLNETVVAAKAAELGFGAVGTKLSEQEKVLARYALIMDQTQNAQGDFARTSDSLANAQRRLTAQTDDLSSSLGQAMLPVQTAIVNGLSKIIEAVKPYAGNIVKAIADGLTAAIHYIAPALAIIGQIFSIWLKPGSPPKLLPDLIIWGMAAANEYIKGWTKADFGILDGLGQSIETILRSFVSSGKLNENDLVGRVLGSRDAITKAIAEFKEFGSVSQRTLADIARYAGPAGSNIAALVDAYFDLQKSSEAVKRAQDDLNRVTAEYDAIISPIQGKLDEVQQAQRKLSNQQELIGLQNTINNFDATAAQKEQARLRIQEIALQEELDNAEKRKDAATDTAQTAVDSATDEQKAAQERLDAAQGALQQQVATNNLLGEQAALEERLRKEREAAAEQARREAEALQQAILQYQLGLTDTQGKIRLLRGELAKTATGSAEYYALLGQIHDLEQQAADEAARNAEQLADAQLDYQLQLQDTAGKIAILKEELKKAQPGSIEYFNRLTQIAALEQQLAESGGGGIGGQTKPPAAEEFNIDSILTKDQQESLDKLNKEIAAAVKGITDIGNITPQVRGLASAFGDVGTAIKSVLTALGIFSANTEKSISPATDSIDKYGKAAFEIGKAPLISQETLDNVAKFAENLKSVADALQGIADFLNSPVWKFLTTEDPISQGAKSRKSIREWLGIEESEDTNALDWFRNLLQGISDLLPGSEPKDTSSPLYGLGDRGAAIVSNVWDGAKAKWDELFPWWSQAWQFVKDLLPGSEPADSSSPLSNLAASGRAILNNIWDGLKEQWKLVLDWWAGDDGVLKNFPDRITDFFKAIYDAGAGLFISLWNGIKAQWLIIYNWWNGEEGVLKTFPKAITGAATTVYDAGVKLFDSLWNGLKKSWKSISDWWNGPSGVWTNFLKSLSALPDWMNPFAGGAQGSSVQGSSVGGFSANTVDQVRNSMQQTAPSMTGNVNGFRQAAGDTTNSTTNHLGGITININGATSPLETAQAVDNQLRRSLRAAGVTI